MKICLVLLFSFLFIACQPGEASRAAAPIPLSDDCRSSMVGSRSLEICVMPGARSPRGKSQVLYFLHPLGSSGRPSSEPLKSLLQELRSQMGDRAPSVISLSLGGAGLFDETSSESLRLARSAEQDLFGAEEPARHLIGFSMGGFNALRLLRAEPTAFRSASLLCPALIAFNPFSTAEKQAYLDRHSKDIDESFLSIVEKVLIRQFPNEQAWHDNEPFTALAQGSFDGAEFFVSVGEQDQLGFEEGAAIWSQRAKERAMNVIHRPVTGRHCAWDDAGLRQFLFRQLTLE